MHDRLPHNAKNTLTKNYLYLAEKAGAEVYPMTTVTSVEPLPGGGYAVDTGVPPTAGARRFTAQQVVFAASALGTAKPLHRLRTRATAPAVRPARRPDPDQLRIVARGNRQDKDVDYSRGVAITSSFHPDDITHIEPVRYGKGSNAMSLLQTVLTDGDGDKPRWRTWLRELGVQRKNIRRCTT